MLGLLFMYIFYIDLVHVFKCKAFNIVLYCQTLLSNIQLIHSFVQEFSNQIVFKDEYWWNKLIQISNSLMYGEYLDLVFVFKHIYFVIFLALVSMYKHLCHDLFNIVKKCSEIPNNEHHFNDMRKPDKNQDNLL